MVGVNIAILLLNKMKFPDLFLLQIAEDRYEKKSVNSYKKKL